MIPVIDIRIKIQLSLKLISTEFNVKFIKKLSFKDFIKQSSNDATIR